MSYYFSVSKLESKEFLLYETSELKSCEI